MLIENITTVLKDETGELVAMWDITLTDPYDVKAERKVGNLHKVTFIRSSEEGKDITENFKGDGFFNSVFLCAKLLRWAYQYNENDLLKLSNQ